jgi:hypothetical protein
MKPLREIRGRIPLELSEGSSGGRSESGARRGRFSLRLAPIFTLPVPAVLQVLALQFVLADLPAGAGGVSRYTRFHRA